MEQSLIEIVRERIESGKARLPVLDEHVMQIHQLMASDEFDIGALERLVERDPGLSGELLRLANSSFFGGLEKVLTISDAIMRLGVKRCAELATVVAQQKMYRVQARDLREMAEKLWRHALCSSLGSSWLAGRLEMPEIESEAMLAGLLHDSGKLLVLLVVDDLIQSGRGKFNPTLHFVEEALNSLHCELGGQLLASWDIPENYARIVRHHHDREIDESDRLLLVVRLVDQACNRLGIGVESSPEMVLASTPEAQILRVSEMLAAELEIQLEDVAGLELG